MKIWQEGNLRLERLNGAEAKAHHELFARLRMETFRAYPYFYEGSMEYEDAYLEAYYACENFRALVLFDGERACGISTLIPLRDAFKDSGLLNNLPAAEDSLYWGEVILGKAYRGKNLLSLFVNAAADIARELGLRKIVYLSIAASPDDDARPADYRDSNAILARFGFSKVENAGTVFEYRSCLTNRTEPHKMEFYEADVSKLILK